MDLPTYTNIWRIEKRLYKLYDFRLPAPLPITWIGVFVGITVPYIFFLVVIGLPFNHNLVWLYVLPPGVLTWLTTRPVIESKRLPELVSSQLRYVSEPRTWVRLAPLTEKDEILVSVRVWHRHPPRARSRKLGKAAGRVQQAQAAAQAGRDGHRRCPARRRPGRRRAGSPGRRGAGDRPAGRHRPGARCLGRQGIASGCLDGRVLAGRVAAAHVGPAAGRPARLVRCWPPRSRPGA